MRPAQKIINGLKDILAGRYRDTFTTQDGTTIIRDARTGVTASGASLEQAEANFKKAVQG